MLTTSDSPDATHKAVKITRPNAEVKNAAGQFISGLKTVENVARDNGQLLVTLNAGVTDYSDLPAAIIGQGYKLTLFKEDEINLETAFMKLTKGITS